MALRGHGVSRLAYVVCELGCEGGHEGIWGKVAYRDVPESQTKVETFFDLATHVTEGRTDRRKDGRREVINFLIT